MKVESMNELQKYKEQQRRTKLIYGADLKRMIEKSDVSKYFFQKDLYYQNLLKCEHDKEKDISGNDDDGV